MAGYLIIYTKQNYVGHVRYEIGDDHGYKEIRGLSIKWDIDLKHIGSETIYEKGEEDSNYISVYDQSEYLASDIIPLEREELIGAMVYTRENDDNHEEYGILSQN